MNCAAWWVVVPMKDTRQAKSRLLGTPGERRQLAIVMARDTLCAAVNAQAVGGVLVVCDRDDDIESFALPGVTVIARHGLDLNAAIGAGAAHVRAGHPERSLAAIPGDLPYLRSDELDTALLRAASHAHAVVPDRAGDGTVMLTARAGSALDPRFGPDSFARHRDAGAAELTIPSWWGLRGDVDVAADLVLGGSLGIRTRSLVRGRHSAALVGSWT